MIIYSVDHHRLISAQLREDRVMPHFAPCNPHTNKTRQRQYIKSKSIPPHRSCKPKFKKKNLNENSNTKPSTQICEHIDRRCSQNNLCDHPPNLLHIDVECVRGTHGYLNTGAVDEVDWDLIDDVHRRRYFAVVGRPIHLRMDYTISARRTSFSPTDPELFALQPNFHGYPNSHGRHCGEILVGEVFKFFRRLVVHGDLNDDVRIRYAICIIRKEFQPGRGRIWDIGFAEAKRVIGTFFAASRKFEVYILIER